MKCDVCGLEVTYNCSPDAIAVTCSNCLQKELDPPKHAKIREPKLEPLKTPKLEKPYPPKVCGLVWIYDRGASTDLKKASGRLAYFLGYEKTESGVSVYLTNGEITEVVEKDIKRYPKENIGIPREEQEEAQENVQEPIEEVCLLCQPLKPEAIDIVCKECQQKLEELTPDEAAFGYAEALRVGDKKEAAIYRALLKDEVADSILETERKAKVVNFKSIEKEQDNGIRVHNESVGEDEVEEFELLPLRRETLPVVGAAR